MDEKTAFGLTETEIAFLSGVGQIVVGLAALLLTILNLRILRRINIVESLRRVNDKFSEINNLEIENENLIKLNPFNYATSEPLNKGKIQEIKKCNLIHNYLNILESVFLEMRYRTLKKSHAEKILKSFIPGIMSDEKARELLEAILKIP